MKIAILYICTGDYVYFWEKFCLSFRESFIPGAEKDFFIFTDAEKLYGEEDDPHIHKIFQESLGWPGNTLYRFRIFAKVKDLLVDFDYIFYFNANMVCLETVTAKEFLPGKNELLVVQHPGNFAKRPYQYPYDRNKASRAYIPYTSLAGKHYVCGGVNGGRTEAYLQMISELERRIDEDDRHGVVAKWHDESQLNRYIIDYPSYRLLTPSYVYPEGWHIPFEQKIMVLDKEKYIPLPATKVQVYERSVWYKRYAGYLRTYAERAGTACRNLCLEVYFRLHKC